MHKIIFAIYALIFSNSCQTKYNANQGNDGKQKVSLNGLSPREVVNLKYEKFSLDCQIRLKDSGHGGGDNTPSPYRLSVKQTFSLDVLDALSGNSGGVLGSEDLQFFAVIKPLRLEVQPYRVHTAESGQSFGLKNSPELVVQLDWHGLKNSQRVRGQIQARLVETFQTPLLQWSQALPQTSGESLEAPLAIDCRLDARPKPAFQDEIYKK